MNSRIAVPAVLLVAVVALSGCDGNKSALSANAKNTTATAGSAPSPLVRSRLAPKQVGTPTAGMHCHMLGDSPATYRPDPACTPGAIDPAVTQANIGATICTAGYTAKVRPSSSATGKVKKAMYGAYGLANGTPSELDHLVSLELGGSNDVANLWPEPGSVPNPKDAKAENPLHELVCARVRYGGKTPYLPLADAQRLIATDWTTAVARAQQYLVKN